MYNLNIIVYESDIGYRFHLLYNNDNYYFQKTIEVIKFIETTLDLKFHIEICEDGYGLWLNKNNNFISLPYRLKSDNHFDQILYILKLENIMPNRFNKQPDKFEDIQIYYY